MRLVLISILVMFSVLARAGVCAFASKPQIISQAQNELHQVWIEEDRNEFWSSSFERSSSVQEYLSEIKKHIGNTDALYLLKKEYDDLANSTDSRLRAEAANLDLVLHGHAGHVRSMNCLENLLLEQQLRRGLSWKRPMEFSAFVLTKTMGARSFLKVYYSTNDRPGGKFKSEVMDRIRSDIHNGWVLSRHVHNHNFNLSVSNGIVLQGAPSPGLSDVDAYRTLSESMGLMAASVTNGFDTVDVQRTEFETLHSK